MLAELGEADRRKRVGATFKAEGVKQVSGKTAAEFHAATEHPPVSFVTMQAPSPDWFTGRASVPLRHEGVWRERVEGLLPVGRCVITRMP